MQTVTASLPVCLGLGFAIGKATYVTVIFLVLENPLLIICVSFIFSSQVLVTCNRINRCSYESCC